MPISITILLFSMGTLLRLDILAWVIALPVLVAGVILLVRQFKQSRLLAKELAQLRKVKPHSIEYEMVMKAMKLCVWRIDVMTHEVVYESDYRDNSDNYAPHAGTTVEDVIGQFADEYQETALKLIHDLMAGRVEDINMQYRMRKPHSDDTYWSEGYATVDRRDLEGRPLSIVGTSMRIDQQKEIESALMDAVYHAEESDRLKSAFLANISHEIRTPLNAIVGFSDILPMVEDEEERKKLVGLIRQNNTHLLRLFDDIVSMSKLEARSGEALKKASFDLKPLFQELMTKYAARSEEKGIPVVIENADALPKLNTDRDRLREILNQFVNNALKFTSKGQVTLGCSDEGTKWRIWVRDTGKGIPQEDCNERIFERFVKLDEFVPGTGLGLSICRSLAMSLGGEVGVFSTFGEGSTFWVELEKE